ncbi:hypothetical protein ANN_26845 [Periplaneta americana]|uniref:Uncharacterized protein n=1 Tax=Periplaneta americana TaxID=6978 RepID=A0ABQ8RZ66_PERAM|nr:hypothetical protein ANN_26845 [Periplaneta americana]
MDELRKLIEDLAKEVKQGFKKYNATGKIQDFETYMHHVVNRLECLERKVDYLENQSRRNNIVIYSVHEENRKRWGGGLEDLVRHVVAQIDIDFVDSDIERAHRYDKLIINGRVWHRGELEDIDNHSQEKEEVSGVEPEIPDSEVRAMVSPDKGSRPPGKEGPGDAGREVAGGRRASSVENTGPSRNTARDRGQKTVELEVPNRRRSQRVAETRKVKRVKASYNGWGDHRANHTVPTFWLDDRPPLLGMCKTSSRLVGQADETPEPPAIPSRDIVTRIPNLTTMTSRCSGIGTKLLEGSMAVMATVDLQDVGEKPPPGPEVHPLIENLADVPTTEFKRPEFSPLLRQDRRDSLEAGMPEIRLCSYVRGSPVCADCIIQGLLLPVLSWRGV